MMGLLGRLVLAVVVGVVVTLLCLLFGDILEHLEVSIAVVVGAFLVKWAFVLGVLAALWYFFAGGFSLPNWPQPRPPQQ